MTQLTGLTDFVRVSASYQALLGRLRQRQNQTISVLRAARPYLVGALASDWPSAVIFITPQIKRTYNISEQLPVWLRERRVYGFTEPTAQFYERVPWVESAIHSRLESLAALMDEETDSHPVIVTSARALMQRTLSAHLFRQQTLYLQPAQLRSVDKLLAHLVGIGYEPTSLVSEPGTFSRRGGVIDIFPIAADQPARLDFFGDEIESIRLFDPATQRTTGKTLRLRVTPAREALPNAAPRISTQLAGWFAMLAPAEDGDDHELKHIRADAEALDTGGAFPFLEYYLPFMYPNPTSLLDYAPLDALIVIEDRDALQAQIEEIELNAERARAENAAQLPVEYPRPYLRWAELEAALHERLTLNLTTGGDPDPLFRPGERFGGQLRPMLTSLRSKQRQGEYSAVVTQQAERFIQLWREQDNSEFVPTYHDLLTPPNAPATLFIHGSLHEGWTLQTERDQLHLVTDAEIFGWNRPEPRRRKTAVAATRRAPESDYADWKPGDPVVHVDYGIGQFAGMVHRTVDGNERQYLHILYADNSALYVPIHQADRLMRYIGADDAPPTLSTLGKPEWERVKARVAKAVQEEATDLLALYAERAQINGYAFPLDTHWQHELEASFPYIETDDQLRSIREVKADMESARPMDRLICGDVGYGKTEVALRAAFKAVMSGKQVAVLVPTTVLAQQHYENFRLRLVAFPIQIEAMSRFRDKEEVSRMLPKLADGQIDIIIGTHRLLSADITLKDLGLVIIDEEQRFGVKQKEHFKALRTQVDVLTLTATPIPRTLYMSLVGVRDISMIQTPPEERLPIINHVGRFDDRLVRQAILRELERGGQVFVVHNRVKTIDALYERLAEIVPEARIVVGHGQMNDHHLAEVMTAFGRGDYDILLATAIIENGIDIPNANTLIVDRADLFGLSQLYQLRGRVGRSAQQAYAYFFHPRQMTDDARQRLEALAENTQLGAGYQLAMRDLEMRGAGDILSTRQTGHVTAIGLHLYTQMLNQTIRRMKGESVNAAAIPASAPGIIIDLPLAAYIPDDWIPDMALRLQIYRRIGGLVDQESVAAMRQELQDRFGQLPLAVDGMLFQIEVKLLAQRISATHILARDRQVQVKLPYLGEVNRQVLAQRLGGVEVSRTAISFAQDDAGEWRVRLIALLSLLAGQVKVEMSGM